MRNLLRVKSVGEKLPSGDDASMATCFLRHHANGCAPVRVEDHLTACELEVLRKITSDPSNQEIADELIILGNTVIIH